MGCSAEKEKSDVMNYLPNCILGHELINKLAIIVGHCELLQEQSPEGSPCLKRLEAIRDVAKAMAEEITRHQYDAMARSAAVQPPSTSRRT